MKAWQKFVIVGLLVGLLNGVAMPIIITIASVALGIILGGAFNPPSLPLYLIIFYSIAVPLIIGVLFVRYATYEKGSRNAFKNFTIGFLFPTLIFLNLWIIQTAFVYIGCLLGERWKEK
jgi:hypothetical protein